MVLPTAHSEDERKRGGERERKKEGEREGEGERGRRTVMLSG